MKIGSSNILSVSFDAKAARAKSIQEFMVMQAAMQAQRASQPQTTTQAAGSAPPLVSPTTNPLSGSPAEVFARTGVISVTEPTRATVTFEGADTDFRNTLIMYKLDEQGVFKDAQTVFPNASSVESGGWMKGGQSSVEVDLAAGDKVGFALLPNGFSNHQSRELLMRDDGKLGLVDWRGQPANMLKDSPENVQLVHIDDTGMMQPISGAYGNKLLHSTGNASQGVQTNYGGNDFADQLVDAERGKLLMGFDDKLDGTETRRNSMLATLNLGKTNAAALDRAPIDDKPTSFREISGADRNASTDEVMETARMFDENGDGRLNGAEWAKFAPLLNLAAKDHKHFMGLRGRGDIDSLSYLINKGDANGDGAIGENELLELRRRLNGNDPNAIQSFREAAGADRKLDYNEFLATAESFDKNGDGFDKEEWDRFAPVLGMRPEDRELFVDAQGKFDISMFKTVFEVADVNGDGQLDSEEVMEMRRLVLEHMTTEEKDTDDEMKTHFPPLPQPPIASELLRNWLLSQIAGLDVGQAASMDKKST